VVFAFRPAQTGSRHFQAAESMNRSSARPRRAFFALVIAIGVVALGGVAWTTQEQSRRLDETAGRADATRASEAAVLARAIMPDGVGRQIRRDVQRFDERIVVGHAAETYAGVALMLLVPVMAAAIFILRELRARARINAALLESRSRLELGERRLRAIADNMPACIAYVDKTETYRFTNAAFTTLFGIPHESFIGRTMTEMMGRPTRDELAAYVEGALAGRTMHFERHGMATQPDSTFMVSYVPDVNAGGEVDGFYVMSLDITARKRAEMELANSERRLRTITDNLPATVVRMDANLICSYANEQMRRVYGIDPTLLLGMSHRAFRGEEEWAHIGPHVEAALRGELRRFEVPARVNGRQEWVQQSLIPDIDAQGRVVGYLSVTFDITERKLQEAALRKSEGFLDRTGRMAGIGGWEVDLVTRVVVWSQETRRIHGVVAEYVPELHTALQFYPPEARALVEEAVRSAMTDGTPWDLEVPFLRADGRRLWVRTVGSAEFASGVPIRLVGAFQDISDKVAQRLAIKEVNDRVALATESGGIGIWELNIATGELIWDARMYELYGDASGGRAAPALLWNQRVHPDDLPGLREAFRTATLGDRLLDRDYRIVLDDGQTRHLRGTARAVRDASGQPTRLIGATWDITEMRELADELAEDRSLLSVTLESIGDAVITTNARGQITWLNPVAERLTGWSSQEAIGRVLTQVFHVVDERTRESTPDPVKACLEQGGRVADATSTLLSRNGEAFGIEDSIAPIKRADGTVLGTVLVFHDVSEQRRLTGEMSWRATHDALTGLVNRAEFEARLARLLQTAQESGGEHALLHIDLDQFKLVNDACGHAVGDQLLQQMARMLTDSVRARDTIARLGGDEFAILMERCTVDQAQRVAQKMCDRMDDFRFLHEDRRLRIGMSIGLVPVDQRWQTTAAIQQAADTSCYAAKEAGRNRVHTWFDTDVAMRERQYEMQWTTRIEQALDEDTFVLYAQRLTPLKAPSDAVRGVHAEVLLRMRQEGGPLVSPGAFLPAAERFHLASRIDRWVLRHAVDWMLALEHPSRIELLSVNLSGQSVGDRSFHRWALELLAKAGPRLCGALCLEITETAAVTNIADAAVFIDQVRALRVKVALDDFGAGAASFGYLKTLRVDTLKIDGQFVRDLVDDPLDEVAVRCFTAVAKVMGLTTVAEFVDKPAVLARLHELDVDFAQGYLLHEPAPIGELIELIEPVPAVA
jgi:diguanylate cyclase (GGDEF)-like protein/PAS domain S-box-containing protein